MKTNQHLHAWADLAMEYPTAAWALGIFGAIVFLTVNFGWWFLELPALVNAHDDSRLLIAFAGSTGFVVFDAVTGIGTWRAAHRISAALRNARIDHDDKI